MCGRRASRDSEQLCFSQLFLKFGKRLDFSELVLVVLLLYFFFQFFVYKNLFLGIRSQSFGVNTFLFFMRKKKKVVFDNT